MTEATDTATSQVPSSYRASSPGNTAGSAAKLKIAAFFDIIATFGFATIAMRSYRRLLGKQKTEYNNL